MPGVAHVAPTYSYVSSSVSSLIHASCDDTKSRRTRQGWAMVEHERSSLCSHAPPPRPTCMCSMLHVCSLCALALSISPVVALWPGRAYKLPLCCLLLQCLSSLWPLWHSIPVYSRSTAEISSWYRWRTLEYFYKVLHGTFMVSWSRGVPSKYRCRIFEVPWSTLKYSSVPSLVLLPFIGSIVR